MKMRTVEQIHADIQQMGEQARAQSSEWFDNRKRNFAIDDGQRHVDSLNKMQSDHDTWMNNQQAASDKRIADYQQQAFSQIEESRNEQQFDEPTYEPDSDEGLADELLNRMNEK